MLNAQEVRVVAAVLGLFFLGTVVKACRPQPVFTPGVESAKSRALQERQFKKSRPVQMPD